MALRFINITELHDKTSEVVRRLDQEDVVVTHRGKPKALLRAISEEDLEDYALAHHPEFQRALELAYQDVQADRVSPLEELIARTREELGLAG